MENRIEFEIYELLKKQNLTITTAESCTGGLIAATLINVPGISAYLKEGYITYSDETKEKLLGVSAKTLEIFTAVSRETAEEMAKGAAKRAGADLSLTSTGIAGPDGGTKEQPVGLVYLGCCFKGDVYSRRFVFEGDRQQVRRQAVMQSLVFAKEIISGEEQE